MSEKPQLGGRNRAAERCCTRLRATVSGNPPVDRGSVGISTLHCVL